MGRSGAAGRGAGLLAATALVMALAGCGGADDTSQSTQPTQGLPAPDSSGGTRTESACHEVRAGIDAFNQGDYQGTVDHFQQAVPLARSEDDARHSQASSDLLAAVQYYAQLAPDDYLQASATSPEFAKYKAITLGQCEAADGDGGDSGGGSVHI